MLDQKAGVPKQGQRLLPGKVPSSSPRQRRLMLVALVLLLVSLVAVLYRDRDFWFPDPEEADGHLLSPSQAQDTPSSVPTPATAAPPRKTEKRARAVSRGSSQSSDDSGSAG